MVEAGRTLFRNYCSSCDGLDGKGKGPAASALNTAPADLSTISRRHQGSFPASDLSRYIDGRVDIAAHGTREMPIWGRAFQEKHGSGDIADSAVQGDIVVLIEYLRSIQE